MKHAVIIFLVTFVRDVLLKIVFILEIKIVKKKCEYLFVKELERRIDLNMSVSD